MPFNNWKWPYFAFLDSKLEKTRIDKESIMGPSKKLLNDVTFYGWNIQKNLIGYYFVFMLMYFNNEHNFYQLQDTFL